MWVGRREQVIPTRAANRHSQTTQEVEKIFLGYPEVSAWNLLQQQKSMRVAV